MNFLIEKNQILSKEVLFLTEKEERKEHYFPIHIESKQRNAGIVKDVVKVSIEEVEYDAVVHGVYADETVFVEQSPDPNKVHRIDVVHVSEVKPYLFPLSSMTEEQKKFFKDRPIFLDSENELVVKEDFFGNSQFTLLDDWMEVILWLNANHFDYKGLIPKGLAIDCTNLNIY